MLNARFATRSFLDLLARERSQVYSVLSLAVAVNLFLLAIPLAIQTAVNQFTLHLYSQPTIFLLIAFLALLLVSSIMRAAQTRLVEFLQRRLFADSVIELVRFVPEFKQSAFHTPRPQVLAPMFFESISIQKSMASILIDGFQLGLQTVLGLLLISFYSPVFFVYSFFLGFSIYGVVFILGRGAMDAALLESKKKYAVLEWIDEMAVKPLLFRGARARHFAESRAAELLEKYFAARSSYFKIIYKQEVGLLLIAVFASVILLAVGGFLVVRDTLSIGQLVATEIIITNILLGLFKFSKLLGAWYSATVAAGKMDERGLSELRESFDGSLEVRSGRANEWKIEAVTYHPEGTQQILFRDLNFEFRAGSRTAIIAPNGAGKSSLFQLMLGFSQPDSGAVLLDGHRVTSYEPSSLRNQVMLLRETEVFSGSIYENVAMGLEGVAPERVAEVLEELGAWGAVQNTVGGIHSEIHSDGKPLSNSPVRLLMLARAVIHQPSTLILDGFLDFFDTETVARVAKVLSAPDRNWTLIVGTSDPLVAEQFADRRSL
jgi:ABC-type bacteriocin/lantibiotic exporter with double-glycine peptidase domain